MSDLSAILKILEEIIRLEKKVEETIASETDKSRREKIEKAFKDKNLTTEQRRILIADILYNN
jgi:hypothetical protein